jgi:hypothetical protein
MAITHGHVAPGAVFHSDSKTVGAKVFPGFVTRTAIDSSGVYRGAGGVLAAS